MKLTQELLQSIIDKTPDSEVKTYYYNHAIYGNGPGPENPWYVDMVKRGLLTSDTRPSSDNIIQLFPRGGK